MSEDKLLQTPNLPAYVEKGSALAVVLAWPQYLDMTSGQMYAIHDIIKRYPQLDTQFRVDMLADMAAYYGVDMGRWFDELVSEHGVERVYLAADCIEAFALRGRYEETGLEAAQRDAAELADMVEWLGCLAHLGYSIETTETANYYLTRLGGSWAEVRTLSEDAIERIMHGEEDTIDRAVADDEERRVLDDE